MAWHDFRKSISFIEIIYIDCLRSGPRQSYNHDFSKKHYSIFGYNLMTSFFEEFLLMYSMLIADLQLSIKECPMSKQHERDPGGPMINERNSRVACSNPNILYSTQHFCGKKIVEDGNHTEVNFLSHKVLKWMLCHSTFSYLLLLTYFLFYLGSKK